MSRNTPLMTVALISRVNLTYKMTNLLGAEWTKINEIINYH